MAEVMNQDGTAELVKREDAAAAQMLTLAQAYDIDCPEMADAAAEDLGGIKARLKQLDETRLAMTRPLDESKRRIMDLFEKPRSVLVQAESALKNALGSWQQKERVRLEEERRRQQEVARKQAEDLARQQAEADRRAEEAHQAGDHAAAAEAAAEADLFASTAQVVQSTAMAPAPKSAGRVKGVSSRENWKAECVDLMALVKAVAAGQASIDLLMFNQPEGTKRAKALRSEFSAPGVRVWSEAVVSARAKP